MSQFACSGGASRDFGASIVMKTMSSADWIVDPEHETVTVYRSSAEGYVVVLTAGRADSVRAPPFEDVELRVAQLFGD